MHATTVKANSPALDATTITAVREATRKTPLKIQIPCHLLDGQIASPTPLTNPINGAEEEVLRILLIKKREKPLLWENTAVAIASTK
mmetsp:Transcript_73813/g.163014  ORF Transcript_73813/g.163014 Transcript_73813/m.163014 type:complete len:87 (-) Transcript_73813:164-424(-)